MKRILFVDDEPMILRALSNALRKRRSEWEMVFAPGGAEALVELDRGAFDVVVSDMRMPGIDGVALLQQVKARFPRTARIILSGHAERDAVINSLPVSHQFLSKPCETQLLVSVIERACGLQALLQDETVRSVVGRIDRLPSIPKTYWELSQAAARPDVGLADLAKIVERDTAMASKVLQLVNSSYFGLAQRQASVQQAVAYLGMDLLKALALSAHVFSSGVGPAVPGFSLDALQAHSVRAANLARSFLDEVPKASVAFTAALVHDIGKMLLAMSFGEALAEVHRVIGETKQLDEVVEKEKLGVTHAEVGAYLLGLWGLPLDIVEAVAYHHHPELAAPASTPTPTLVVVHVADALSHVDTLASGDPTANGRLNVAFVESSPFGTQLPRWRELAHELHTRPADAASS